MPPRALRFALFALLGAAACDEAGTVLGASSDGGLAPDGAPADASLPPGTPDAPASDAPGAADASDLEARVSALLARMTLDEKLGQMSMGGYTSLASVDDITTYALGSIGGAPYDVTPADWLPITAGIRAHAAATRLGIPAFIAIDAVHGNGKVHGATLFPHHIGLGCSRDADLVRQVEQATGQEVAALGQNLAEAPAVDVGRDLRWGRLYESFSEDPALVAPLGVAAVQGLVAGGVLPVVKHFLGAGGTTWGTGINGGIDQGDAQLTEAQMRAVHLPPFQAAVKAGVQVVMVSYSAWQGAKMSTSPHFLTDVLKTELGFDGVVMTDGGAILELPGTLEQQASAAVSAGIDLVNVAQPYAALVAAMKTAVGDGSIAPARVDDAVRRILRVKMRAGLFDAPAPDPADLPVVGSAAHRAIARQAVRESLVLLKNDAATLPLAKSARVHVAGKGAADLGIQSGGWTLAWQGVTGRDAASFGGGTTILDALRATAATPGLVTYSADGSGAAGADVGVVVLHELPYAEYHGDTPDPRFDQTATPNIYDGTAATVVANMKAAGIPLVMLLVTGRPVRIESMLPSFRAVVATWLPGSEGQGVADVLYGDAPFVGVLSHSWPKDASALPLTFDQVPYDPLFAYGFGLR